MEKIMTDKFGWKYYENLPEGFRLATMSDFHDDGIKKEGLKYLIKRAYEENHYEIHHVKDYTRSQDLKPFLDHEMVFIKSN